MNRLQRLLAPFRTKDATIQDAFKDFGLPVHNLPFITSTMDALKVVAVWAAARVIAEDIGQIPWRLMREDADGSKELVRDHRLADLVRWKPNRHQTSMEFRETVCFHAALEGNAYIFLDKVGNDREILSMLPIEPARVSPVLEDDVVTYRVRTDSGQPIEIPADLIWHLKGPSWSPWVGMNPIMLAAKALRLAMNLENSQDQFFENGAQVAGVLSTESKLSPDNYKKWRDALDSQFKKDRANRALILDMGAKWTSNVISASDAQQLEQRRHQIEEVARLMRVQPIMLMQSDKATTYASAEQMFIVHVRHTLRPWVERFEQSADVNILTDDERQGGIINHLVLEGLLRGDHKARADYFSRALGSGGGKPWLTQNDVRRAEGQPKSDEEGADSLKPMQQEAAQAGAPDGDNDDNQGADNVDD